MAKMQRPCWTIAFGIICLLVVPGAILTHLAVAKLIPSISDLPVNVAKGFDEVFKFAYLQQDSNTVKTSCASALSTCGVMNAAVQCPANPTSPLQKTASGAGAAKVSIQSAFKRSLTIVNKIAGDVYFGTPALKDTADKLSAIVQELDKISPTMKCYEAVPTFCSIYTSADGIVKGMAQVDTAINTFKKSDAISTWNDYKDFLTFLHALPYLTVLSLLLFAIFWSRGGVCCCCRDGTKAGTCALIPSILLWLASFVIFGVVLAVGVAVKLFADKFEVAVLVGKPTMEAVIIHIQTNYADFWRVVFFDLEEGLDQLLLASYFFVGASLLQVLYSGLEMCCCPYRKKAEKAAPGAADLGKTLASPPAETKDDQKPADEAGANAEKGGEPVPAAYGDDAVDGEVSV